MPLLKYPGGFATFHVLHYVEQRLRAIESAKASGGNDDGRKMSLEDEGGSVASGGLGSRGKRATASGQARSAFREAKRSRGSGSSKAPVGELVVGLVEPAEKLSVRKRLVTRARAVVSRDGYMPVLSRWAMPPRDPITYRPIEEQRGRKHGGIGQYVDSQAFVVYRDDELLWWWLPTEAVVPRRGVAFQPPSALAGWDEWTTPQEMARLFEVPRAHAQDCCDPQMLDLYADEEGQLPGPEGLAVADVIENTGGSV